VKLLRVLQEGTVERLGAQRPTTVDLRVVAATNRDPRRAVDEGVLRQDLFFRLNVVHVGVPPLRERREDIGLLAEHFLQKYSSELGRPAPLLGEAVMRYLLAYSWPGNVRELENLMERAAVLCSGSTVDAQLLPADLTAAVTGAPAVSGAGAATDSGSLVLDERVGELERRLIEEALQRSGNNKSAASRLLGVSERTLWYKIKKYGL
jgi:two-component system response regulator AtoC